MGRKKQKLYLDCGFVVGYGILRKLFLVSGYLKVREQVIEMRPVGILLTESRKFV